MSPERPVSLDWVEFRARDFPGRRPRHDFQATVAYGAYRHARNGSQPEGPAETRSVLGSGSVKSFNNLSGHGVIRSDHEGAELWVHQRNIVSSPATLYEGERVEFEDRQGGMGPEAINVRSLLPRETSKTSVLARSASAT